MTRFISLRNALEALRVRGVANAAAVIPSRFHRPGRATISGGVTYLAQSDYDQLRQLVGLGVTLDEAIDALCGVADG